MSENLNRCDPAGVEPPNCPGEGHDLAEPEALEAEAAVVCSEGACKSRDAFFSQVLESFLHALRVGDWHVLVVQPGPFKLIFNTAWQFPTTS